MQHICRLLFIAVLALPATAQEQPPLTLNEGETVVPVDEFERFVSGTTLYFNQRGQPYGAEQYFVDRRVIWTFLDGTCERGAWYEDGTKICFVYEAQSEAQCWHFLDTPTGKRARGIGADPANDLQVVGQNQAALNCPGPGVGVRYTPRH